MPPKVKDIPLVHTLQHCDTGRLTWQHHFFRRQQWLTPQSPMSQENKPGACSVWGKQEMVMFFQSEGSRVPGKKIIHFTSVARVQGGHPACWVRSFYALWWDLAEWMEVGSFTFAKSLHCAHGWEESYFFKDKGFVFLFSSFLFSFLEVMASCVVQAALDPTGLSLQAQGW